MIQDFFKALFQDLHKLIIDTLFPIICLSCNKEGEFLCEECIKKLEPVEYQICIVCKKPSLGGLTHPKCISPHSPDQLISFYNYHDDIVEKLIIRGKYYFIPGIFELLGKLIANKLKNDFPNLLSPQPLALSPIPLNKWRHRWRGFNQSEIICQALSKKFNFPIVNALIRKKITRTQKDLKKEDRIKNMESAFALSPLFSKEGVRGSSFLLIDDVTTTGSTLIEAVKVLKRNGAAKVICLTIARD
jgi:competence protein ComFC